ncbi:MAG: hypothetical protein KUG71_01145 [Porticoccaceae bacterium]|nr:hypothetical protein [Porticoccaceae bacterium]
MTTRRKFSREFKLEAVRLVKEQDISVAEILALKKEIRKLKAARDILKKDGASSSVPAGVPGG